MIEVRHLRLVWAIAEEGSITKAGQRLHLTQSAVSCQLREVEADLGAKLFLRLPRRMVPTELGERILRAAQELLPRFESLEADLRGDKVRKPVRISTECYTAYHWLPKLLARMRARDPRLEVEIVLEATRKPASALMEGTIDVAVMTRPDAASRLRFKPLFVDELLIVTAPSHRLAHKAFVEAADLADEHIIIYDMPDEHSTLINEVLRPAGVKARISKVQLTEAILEMVRANLGIACMVGWAIRPYVEDGRLVALKLTRHGFRWEWGIATLKDGVMPAHIKEFVRLLGEEGLGGPHRAPAGLSIVHVA
jgi:LysR family transcriptional regulator, regulator for metE and metH